jgi:hypothetical protein
MPSFVSSVFAASCTSCITSETITQDPVQHAAKALLTKEGMNQHLKLDVCEGLAGQVHTG